jgi:DNA-binding NarL/FixJ family response regulator
VTATPAGAPSTDYESIRVLLVDHQEMFVDSISRTLTDVYDIEVVGTAISRARAVELAGDLRPSVASVSWSLPDGGGISTVSTIREVSPSTRVIMLTDTPDSRLATSAIEAGCSGFLTKDKGIGELVSALWVAHNGNAYLEPEVLATLLPRLDRTYQSPASVLTAREMEVLQLMAGGGLRNKDLATELHLSLHTVRNHVQSVLAKLGAHSKLEAVIIAGREGLLDQPM